MVAEVYDSNYILMNQSSSVGEHKLATFNKASVLVNAVNTPANGDTITLIDTAGVSRTFEFDTDDPASITGGNLRVNLVGLSGVTPTDDAYNRFKAQLDFYGFTTSINMTPSGPGSTKVSLAITQSLPGDAGNTDITFSGGFTGIYNNEFPSKFQGGTGPTPLEDLTAGQFLLGTKSTINIRGQSPTSRYEVFLGEEKT